MFSDNEVNYKSPTYKSNKKPSNNDTKYDELSKKIKDLETLHDLNLRDIGWIEQRICALEGKVDFVDREINDLLKFFSLTTISLVGILIWVLFRKK